MVLGHQRVVGSFSLIDSTLLSRCAVEGYLLDFVNVEVSRDFITVFSNPFFINPKAPVATGIVVVFISHIVLISISRSLYFDSFSVTLTQVFRSDGIAISIRMHSFVVFFLMTISGLLALFLSC